MPLSLYLNDNLTKRVKTAAKAEGVSVSNYIAKSIEQRLGLEYSSDFLSSLGALSDVEISRPKQPPFSDDVKRIVL
ncbi:MAG: ribbon-helix-helix domain-containing protein [Clostridiales Family XIII bacterium]|jgi:hypothetical protein|nr:ribbon-helix-helix domain-containing protein [Clostridiales Family XIII bacterium]